MLECRSNLFCDPASGSTRWMRLAWSQSLASSTCTYILQVRMARLCGLRFICAQPSPLLASSAVAEGAVAPVYIYTSLVLCTFDCVSAGINSAAPVTSSSSSIFTVDLIFFSTHLNLSHTQCRWGRGGRPHLTRARRSAVSVAGQWHHNRCGRDWD